MALIQTNGMLFGLRPVADFGLAILSFSDPDGVHLELTAAL